MNHNEEKFMKTAENSEIERLKIAAMLNVECGWKDIKEKCND